MSVVNRCWKIPLVIEAGVIVVNVAKGENPDVVEKDFAVLEKEFAERLGPEWPPVIPEEALKTECEERGLI